VGAGAVAASIERRRRLETGLTNGPGASVAQGGRRRGSGLPNHRTGPAQQGKEGRGKKKGVRAGRLGGNGSRPTGPLGPKGGREKEWKFSLFFSNDFYKYIFK
jgi:hypothetical protein